MSSMVLKKMMRFGVFGKVVVLLAGFLAGGMLSVFSQGGTAGIQAATTEVKSYFADASNLMLAIGGLVGLIGAVKVYQKWSSGDQDTGKVAAAWFGSCVFLVLVGTVLRAFFGV